MAGTNAEVKIIQRWDGYRPKIRLLLGCFYADLVNQQIKEKEREKLTQRYQNNSQNNSSKTIAWIEKLLQTPIEDYRKNAVSLILAPYFINIKRLSFDNAYESIKDWLNRCDSIKRLDSNFNLRIRYALQCALRKGVLPMRLETLRERNTWLYDYLKILIVGGNFSSSSS
jgi:hypothetical protein